MATIELTKDNFEETLASSDILILDFWAEWCGPCRAFAPIFEAAAEANPDIVFGKIDTQAERELAAGFGIQSIPTIAVFREQVPLFIQPGMLPKNALVDLIQQVRDLDMTEVRAEYEKHAAEHAEAG